MQENVFLSDFFGCVGFLPLTTRSHIRGTMMRMMAHSAAQYQPGARHDSPDQGQFGAIFTEDGITTGNQLSTGPSACTFWCAVGVGALVKGSPVESVANYSRLARDALDAYTGPVDAEVAKAWAILGYFYGFMGDTVQFLEYLKLSGSFLVASIEQGSTDVLPAGFAEIVQYREAVMVYSGIVDAADIDSLAARSQHSPQINRVVTEEDIFPYVAQSLTAFDRRVITMARKKSATRRHSTDGDPCEADVSGSSLHGNAPRAEEVSEAMVTGFKDGLIDFEHLQDAADRSHVAHGILAALAAIDDSRARGLYNRLQEVYNSSRPPASLPAPPLQQSQRVSGFCDDVHSRGGVR
ncbi:hypothetical protein Esi_0093_0058 [Ectocarpus siliculosus]|uniref:Uncharacterized protein n=1 Tax=Ectocarpus siliculosus TaxID=2880 RepID=D8LU22_ECTSI|nr:hypothetical protein Esi_0093_0058 [Ectocarpus siliculosus]|eukprot:CBN75412.1 hypothetical protein Esi_0093_0058 [Ectocarpus siliculosus]